MGERFQRAGTGVWIFKIQLPQALGLTLEAAKAKIKNHAGYRSLSDEALMGVAQELVKADSAGLSAGSLHGGHCSIKSAFANYVRGTLGLSGIGLGWSTESYEER